MSQVFNVLTEFRFDIAHAVADSRTLQGEVGRISEAADQAHFALQRMSAGLVAQMGLGSGGIAGLLYAAVQAADKFEASQRSIANIFLTNNLFKGNNAFADSMRAAADAMEDMRKAANQFSLPSSDLVQYSKLIGATLVNAGLDSSRLEHSIKLSRGFLKSAPTLGIDPSLAQGQLLAAIMGRASMHETLFQRLSNETSAMHPFSGPGGTQQFNALAPAKRLQVLTDALMQFGSNAQIVSANAMSLSQQMQRLKDNVVGIFSILRPIGKAIMDPLKKLIFQINVFMETKGKALMEILGRIVNDFFKDPEKLFVNIQQFRRLQGDVKKAGNLLFIIGIIEGITEALHFFGITLRGGLIMAALRSVGSGISYIATFLSEIGAFSFMLRALGWFLGRVLVPLALFTMLFQAISRGFAKAQLINAKWVADNLVRIAAAIEQFKIQISAIIAPITMAIEGLSNIFAWLFRLDLSGSILINLFEFMNKIFEVLGRTIVGILSIFAGFVNAFIGFGIDINRFNFKDMWSNIIPNFMEGMTDLYHQYYKAPGLDNANQTTAQTKIDIDKIEINNQFKENAEPDRIAFTLKEQLFKAALNPIQSTGRSLNGQAVGN